MKAATPLRGLYQLMSQAPAGTGHWLAALDFYLSTPKEIAIIGPYRKTQATQGLLNKIWSRYLPNKVLVGSDSPDSTVGKYNLPLLEGRGMIDGRPTAYVCQNYACQLPVTDPEALAAQLDG